MTVPNFAQLDSVDLDIISAAARGAGVLSGCAVTAQGSPDMTVAVASGSVQESPTATAATVSSGNVTITAASATLDRYDLVVADTSTGAKSAIAGTAAAVPVYPAITASKVVLAAVSVPAADTTISSGQITDKRQTVFAIPTVAAFTQVVRKTADEAGPNNTTLQNDNHLNLSGLAAGTYLVEGFLFFTRVSGTSTLKIGFTSSDGSAAFQWSTGLPFGGNAADQAIGATLDANSSAGAKSSYYFAGKLTLTTTANLQLRWANDVGTDPITVYKGSLMRCMLAA